MFLSPNGKSTIKLYHQSYDQFLLGYENYGHVNKLLGHESSQVLSNKCQTNRPSQ